MFNFIVQGEIGWVDISAPFKRASCSTGESISTRAVKDLTTLYTLNILKFGMVRIHPFYTDWDVPKSDHRMS
jgi:hypothetical protein